MITRNFTLAPPLVGQSPPFHGNKARVGRRQVSSYIEAFGLII